jgi:predicted ATP pyrophosphatase (TIGR00289 family)
MKIAALISGGKDSIYAIYKAKQQRHDIVCLIAMESENPESYMFHIPNIHLTKLIAEAMNLPIIYSRTHGKKELELEDLKKTIKQVKEQYKVEGIVTGALASKYQKERIDKICTELGLTSIAPLWHINPEQYMNELIDEKFEVLIVGVASHGLTKDWLMKTINKESVEKLKQIKEKTDFNLAFEGGEAETLVLDCPLYKQKLEVTNYKLHWDNSTNSGHAIINAKLVTK